VPRRPALIVSALASVALAGCSAAGLQTTTNETVPPGISIPIGARGNTPRGPAPTRSQGGSSSGCTRVLAPPPRPGEEHTPAPPSQLRLSPSTVYTVSVKTNCGSFQFVLDQQESPKLAASFSYLVRRGFYDDLTFHRVVHGFVIQGGDPVGNGTGGPGYQIRQPPPRSIRYVRGTVAMAKTGTQPDGTAGSQFFVVTAGDASGAPFDLAPAYALLGHVVSGYEVVQRIGALPVDSAGMPSPPVVMERVTIVSS
jgi:peptidyl-prolyl cis-trans isomerase B (cyclophilin B)